jgi:hypothetical protein
MAEFLGEQPFNASILMAAWRYAQSKLVARRPMQGRTVRLDEKGV